TRSTSDNYRKKSIPRNSFSGYRHYHRDCPIRRRRWQNCIENGRNEGLCRESSRNSSSRLNSNKRTSTRTRQSHDPDRHWLRYLMLCNSTYRCDKGLHSCKDDL
ncbi:unnamed protein product, partial [Hymenolepis diminuta]